MGFGVLFIGYFFLINITYFTFTDLLCAVVMLLALSSLSRYNRPMKAAFITDIVFVLVSLVEFFVAVGEMFSMTDFTLLLSILIPVRYLTVGVLTAMLLFGIRSFALEVGLEKLAGRCILTLSLPAFTYLLSALLEITPLFASTSTSDTQLVALIVLLMTLLSVILILSIIYTAYMRICMPEDVDMAEKPSRFAFVNRYREKKAQRDRQTEEEYRRLALEKQKRKKKK